MTPLPLPTDMPEIAARRRALNITQQAVADAVGVSRMTYAGYENGSVSPSIDTAAKIIDFLNKKLDK